MKAIKKVCHEKEVMRIIFIILITFFCFVGIFIDIIPKFEEIIKSSDPLSWSNSWMLNIVAEFIGIIFVSLLLNVWFINTKRTNNPVLFLSYILGGILFGFIVAVIVLAILATNSSGYWNLWVVEPVFGAWLGLLTGFLLNIGNKQS